MRYGLAFLFVAFLALVGAPKAAAYSLKVAPLEYRVELKSGEKQKGFVDISNPTGESLKVETSVQAFEQTDNIGSLRFYDNEQLSEGVLLDFDRFELRPRQSMRMYFLVDGTKLPSGDVYRAIFFTTTPSENSPGVGQSVRLGTLLNIINGTAGDRNAEITKLNTNFIQLGDDLSGDYSIKNTSDPKKSTGFYPKVTISLSPLYSEHNKTGTLLFAGRERSNEFSLDEARLGFYKLRVSFGESSKEQWVFMATGYWRWVGLGLALGTLLGMTFWTRRRLVSKKAVNFRNSNKYK